jgi:hypothetical protein
MRSHVCLSPQECRRCPPNTYIFRSDDPSFECQPCPPTSTCANGQLLEQTTRQVEVALAVSGLSEADLKNPDRSQVLQDVMRSLAETLEVDLSLIAFDGVVSSQRRQEGAPTKVKFKIYAPAEKASTLAEEILSPKFTAALKTSLAAMNVTATVASVSEPTDASGGGGNTGWVYRLDTVTGKSHLTNCPKGYLVKNDTVEAQTCVECGPTTYSINDLDNCKEGMNPDTWECANRECHVSCFAIGPYEAVCVQPKSS